MHPKRLVIPILILLLLLACNIPTQFLSATDTPEAERPTKAPEGEAISTDTPAAPALPELPTAAPVVPTDVPLAPSLAPAALPAAVYFISDQVSSGGATLPAAQVWRLEQDGVTLTQVTQEPAPVTEMSVSGDGRVAYVSNNDLWVINADGSERTMLVDGPPTPAQDDNNRINLELSNPRWSPDGSRLVYGLNGVNLIPGISYGSEPGAPLLLLQSDPVPQPPDYGAAGPVRFYRPLAWSPDGSYLLLDLNFWMEGGGKAVMPAGGGQPVILNNPDGMVCCEAAWSSDSASVYFANPYFGMVNAGLWRADAASGQGYTLIPGDPGNGVGPFNMPGFPFQSADGWLYYFFAQSSEFPTGDVRLGMYRASADGLTGQQRLRTDEYLVSEALWAWNGSGAVIVDFSNAPMTWPRRGKLLFLKSDGSPAVQLAGMGYYLRWGP